MKTRSLGDAERELRRVILMERVLQFFALVAVAVILVTGVALALYMRHLGSIPEPVPEPVHCWTADGRWVEACNELREPDHEP